MTGRISISINSSKRNANLDKGLVYLCLLFSGSASLVYELIWIKQLTLIFGGALYAISAVLCAFMTGLGLGAWLASKLFDRVFKEKGANFPLVLYGLFEGAIGLYGLAFPWILKLLESAYPGLFSLTGGSGLSLHICEFFMAALLMLPSTFLMGATLPILGRWFIRDEARAIVSNIGILYGLNTFGAVLGCLYAQSLAVQWFGVWGASLSAAAMNFFVLALIFLLKKRATGESEEIIEPPSIQKSPKASREQCREPSGSLQRLLLLIFIYSGMASLAGEILWTRILVFPLGSALFSFALILACFLFGIALGSWIAGFLPENSDWVLYFLLVEILIGVSCIAIMPMFHHLTEWTALADQALYELDNSAGRTLLIRSAFAFGLMFIPTLGFGLIFPLANRINYSLFGSVGKTLGGSYSANTLGAVLGTVLTPFLFIPLMGIRLSIFVIFLGMIALSLASLAIHLKWSSSKKAIAFGILIIGSGISYGIVSPQIKADRPGKGNFTRIEIDAPKESIKLLDYKEGDFSTLGVVEDARSGARTIYMNGFSTATSSDSIGGSAYMQAMGFVPMALHPKPEKALVICFGTGTTLGAVSSFPDVSVDAVEIDRNVLDMAHWFSRWNKDVLNKPNIDLNIQDGRTYMRWTPKKYDVITLEPMSPVQAGVVNLYSREFYRLARKRMNPGGVFLQWLPLHLVGPEDARSIVKTFRESFPHMTIWNSFLTRIVLLAGSDQAMHLDKARLDTLMENKNVKTTAREIGIRSFIDFADFFISDGKPLKGFLESAETITDDNSLLEHSPTAIVPPLKWQTDQSFLNLLKQRVDQKVPAKNIPSFLEASLQHQFKIRTAQRLSVFARRYKGPGETAFAKGDLMGGLQSVADELKARGGRAISLSEAQWR